jgi:SCY1-like protein 1
MDFLRQGFSLAQQALAKGQTIPGLPQYGLGERKSEFDGLSLWTLYDGNKRVSVQSMAISASVDAWIGRR